ncbi:MAG: hypothetical protein ACPLRY_01900 [Candidatus Bathyarchaeales archaeon]
MNKSFHYSFNLGIFVVGLSWFSFTLYQFGRGIMGQIVYFTDVPASVGLGFRAAAGLISLFTALFYLFKKNLSSAELLISVRWVILLEAVYWLTLFPSAIWGFQFEGFGYSKALIIVSTGLPCLLESTFTPVFLCLLFLKLNPSNLNGIKIKWGLIAGAIYIFVFWFNYTMQWLAEIIRSGASFITCYPVNTFAFTFTAGGLFVLALYTLNYARNLKGESFGHFNLKHIGVIITAFGLYFDINFLLWLLFGSPSGWTMWHTFFIYHNVDLWMLSLPLAGIPLTFQKYMLEQLLGH